MAPSAPEAQPGSTPSHDHGASLGYDTAEAVPMTLYYRDSGEQGGGGKARPTLESLRERNVGGVPRQPAKVRVSWSTDYGAIKCVIIRFFHC